MTEQLVDPVALERWVGDRLPGSGPFALNRITLGASNEMFEVARGGLRWILRRPPVHPISPTAHDMVREFRVLSALEGTDVPHPRPLLMCEDEAVIGVRFYVMDRVDGFSPHQALPPAFEPQKRDLALELVDGIAALAHVDWRARGLDGFGKPDGFLDRQVARWLGQLEKYQGREIPGLDEVAVWLQAHKPPPQQPAIIHGDYQFINVMFAPQPPARLVAIVDWEQSTIGDPLLDIGWVIAGWSEPGEAGTLRFGSRYLPERAGFPSRVELAERYAKQTGRAIDRLDYYVVLSLFKLAIVLEGSYQRFLMGKSTNPVHEGMGSLVVDMFEQAVHTVRTGAI